MTSEEVKAVAAEAAAPQESDNPLSKYPLSERGRVIFDGETGSRELGEEEEEAESAVSDISSEDLFRTRCLGGRRRPKASLAYLLLD